MVKENEQIGFGILSLVLSIIPFFLIWLDVFDFFPHIFFYILLDLPLVLLAMILGLMAYWGAHKDKYLGLAGIIISVLFIPIGLIFSI